MLTRYQIKVLQMSALLRTDYVRSFLAGFVVVAVGMASTMPIQGLSL